MKGIWGIFLIAILCFSLAIPFLQKNELTAAASDSFVVLMSGHLPFSMSSTAAIWDGTNSYLFGGSDGSGTKNTIIRYNPTTNQVTTMSATLPDPISDSPVVYDGHYAYIFGGYMNPYPYSNKIVRYDPSTNTVQVMKATVSTISMSAVWDGHYAYLFGGWDGFSYYNQVLRYDPSSDTITTLNAKFPLGIKWNSAVWTGSYAYIFGGSLDYNTPTNQIFRFDPNTDSITKTSSTLPDNSLFTSAVWTGTSAYIFGGSNQITTSNNIVAYDPTTNLVSTENVFLPTVREATCAIWTGSAAYIFGGDSAGSFYNDIVQFNPGSIVPPVQFALTVSSAHGTLTPSAGSHSYSSGSSVTCSVSSPVTESGVTYTCTGWAGTGSVQSSGIGTTTTFSITQDSSITWNWAASIGDLLILPTEFYSYTNDLAEGSYLHGHLNSVSQQSISATSGQSVSFNMNYQIFAPANPNEIDQLFFVESWAPSLPPNGYTLPVYNGIPSVSPGITTTTTISFNAPSVSGTYYLWLCVDSQYSMQDAINHRALSLNEYPAQIKIVVQAPPQTVATPTFSPSPNTYTTAQSVTISCTTGGASIRYTTDGSDPSSSSTVYSSAISVSSGSVTIKAKAFASGMTDSVIASGTWTITPPQTVATPTFNPLGGTYSVPQTITITCTTSGAIIRYTTDGSDPSTSSATYSNPITINSGTVTIKARGFATGMTTSNPSLETFTILPPTVATPTFSPSGGSYPSAQSIVISCSTSGATIRYTTDGSAPTSSSSIYSSPIKVSTGTLVIKAQAFMNGMTESALTAGTWTIVTPKVATPKLSLDTGAYTGMQTVTITTGDGQSATIRYTTDGTDPITTSTGYSGPIILDQSVTLKARAFIAGKIDSDVASAIYTIILQKAPTPLITISKGSTGTSTVTIDCDAAKAVIRYTTDGTTPTSSSTLYQKPFAVSGTVTIMAIAWVYGLDQSDVASSTNNVPPPGLNLYINSNPAITQGTIPFAITFSALAVGGLGTYSISWTVTGPTGTFSSTGNTLTQNFKKGGSYTVQATVSCSGSSQTATKQITITASTNKYSSTFKLWSGYTQNLLSSDPQVQLMYNGVPNQGFLTIGKSSVTIETDVKANFVGPYVDWLYTLMGLTPWYSISINDGTSTVEASQLVQLNSIDSAPVVVTLPLDQTVYTNIEQYLFNFSISPITRKAIAADIVMGFMGAASIEIPKGDTTKQKLVIKLIDAAANELLVRFDSDGLTTLSQLEFLSTDQQIAFLKDVLSNLFTWDTLKSIALEELGTVGETAVFGPAAPAVDIGLAGGKIISIVMAMVKGGTWDQYQIINAQPMLYLSVDPDVPLNTLITTQNGQIGYSSGSWVNTANVSGFYHTEMLSDNSYGFGIPITGDFVTNVTITSSDQKSIPYLVTVDWMGKTYDLKGNVDNQQTMYFPTAITGTTLTIQSPNQSSPFQEILIPIAAFIIGAIASAFLALQLTKRRSKKQIA